MEKVEEWVEASKGKIRSDVAHKKLLALGFAGSDRSTRRAVAEVKQAYRLGHARVHRPWVTEPGMWLQYDFGDGPVIGGRKTVLFVAWLAWSRFRVVIALRDRTQPSVIAALDRTFRLLGGVPTFVLTDNENTVTVEHVAGVPVRNRETVSFGRHYGVSVLTCAPADPASKGGVEASVKVAKADLVPTDTNLLDEYATFAELEQACAEFMAAVNARVHRVTRRVPVEMLAQERLRLHRVPDDPHTVVFGLARQVPANTPMVTFEHGQYSVPQHLLGAQVWVRAHGTGAAEQVIVVHLDGRGPVKVARHLRATPGSPRLDDDHFGGPPTKQPGQYTVRPRNDAEREFLAIGDGATCGCPRLRRPGRRRSARRWRRRSRWPRSPGTPGSTGRWAMLRCTAGSGTRTSPPSSTCIRRPPPAKPESPAHWPKAPAAGPGSTQRATLGPPRCRG